MQVTTKAYGQVNLDERQIIVFPRGLFGFEQFRRYALFDAAQQPFYILQSLDLTEVAFILIDPRVFRPDYAHGAHSDDLEDLELERADDLLVFAIVTIPEDQSKMTANLQGPVAINKKKRLGKQIISLDPAWQVRHGIMDELARINA